MGQPWVRRAVAKVQPRLLDAAMLALVAISPAAALAQARDAGSAAAMSMKSSCRADYRAHCIGSDPSASIAAACLSQFYVNLSKGCQTALDAYNNPQGEPEEQ